MLRRLMFTVMSCRSMPRYMVVEKAYVYGKAYSFNHLPAFKVSQLRYTHHIAANVVTQKTSHVNGKETWSLGQKLFSPRKPAYKAVIFDKDGTLICFHSMWVPWAKHFAVNISKEIGFDISEKIYDVFGVCSTTFKTFPGLLAEGTKLQIAEALRGTLMNFDIDECVANSLIFKYMENYSVLPEHLSPLHNLSGLFTLLRQHDMRIGICTSDSREGTLNSLADLDILHLVDITLCGDDPEGQPKPDPTNARIVCDVLNVSPEDVVMVGDTPTDVLFAKNANLGLGVGVLSGIGRRKDLEQAWYGKSVDQSEVDDRFQIIPSVADLIPIILPDRPICVRPTSALTTTETSAASSDVFLDLKKYRLIIFDKNGTLTNVHPRWSNWAESLSSRLKETVSSEVAAQFLELIGYSPDTQRASDDKLLASGSILHIKESLGYLLNLNGIGLKESTELIDQLWFSPELSSSDIIPGAADTIKALRGAGFQLALNTSDTRSACDSFLQVSELDGQFDAILSAEDAGRHPKPLPHTVVQIMDTLSCCPEQTIVVGDSVSDLLSGQSAGVASTVGVLSGYSHSTSLLPYANILLPNLTYFEHFLNPPSISS